MSDTLPLSILNNRRLEKWLRFQPDRTVRLAVGKVEIGQGVLIALSQIAAEELDVALDRIDILSGDTADAPDEGSTSSSQSIEVSGRSVRLVSAELRTRVLGRLAQRLNCAADDLSIEDGVFLQNGNPTGQDYWSFSGPEDFAHDIVGSAVPKPSSTYTVVGQPVPRRDLIAKVTGAAFIHDIVRPDMLHARVLRQPSRGARLTDLNEAAIRKAAGGEIRIVRVGASWHSWDLMKRSSSAPLWPLPHTPTGPECACSPPSSRKPPGSAISHPMTGISATPARRRTSVLSSARPTRGPSLLTRHWRHPADWPNIATGTSPSGRTPRAFTRCATVSPTFWA
jgi:Molybdopterin-binding domain of aldehyde dehydrogenase